MKLSLLFIIALFIVSCSNTRGYKVATIEHYSFIPDNNSLEVRYLDRGYSVGDTLVNHSNGLHIEVIVDTVR